MGKQSGEPPVGQQHGKDLFHKGHLGASWMKNLARAYAWWPGMDSDLDRQVKECDACQRNLNKPL